MAYGKPRGRAKVARTSYFMHTGSFTTIGGGRMRWPMRVNDGVVRPVVITAGKKTKARPGLARRRNLYGF